MGCDHEREHCVDRGAPGHLPSNPAASTERQSVISEARKWGLAYNDWANPERDDLLADASLLLLSALERLHRVEAPGGH